MATANEITDYAMPLMNIERMAKQVYNHCLEGDLAAAEEVALQRLGLPTTTVWRET